MLSPLVAILQPVAANLVRVGSCNPLAVDSSSCSGEEEAAAQQPSVDGGQHAAPVGLSLREGAGWFQPGGCLSVELGLGQPGSRGDGTGGGDVKVTNQPG